eukprot:1955073-Rhodomonas_salina.1
MGCWLGGAAGWWQTLGLDLFQPATAQASPGWYRAGMGVDGESAALLPAPPLPIRAARQLVLVPQHIRWGVVSVCEMQVSFDAFETDQASRGWSP